MGRLSWALITEAVRVVTPLFTICAAAQNICGQPGSHQTKSDKVSAKKVLRREHWEKNVLFTQILHGRGKWSHVWLQIFVLKHYNQERPDWTNKWLSHAPQWLQGKLPRVKTNGASSIWAQLSSVWIELPIPLQIMELPTAAIFVQMSRCHSIAPQAVNYPSRSLRPIVK